MKPEKSQFEFEWEEELINILDKWCREEYGNPREPLDGDEVDRLTEVIRAKLNFMEGNTTWEEYLEAF